MRVYVREERLARRWSQQKLAARAGVSVSLLARIERGGRTPTWRMLRRLADGLGVRVVDLVDWSSVPDDAGETED